MVTSRTFARHVSWEAWTYKVLREPAEKVRIYDKGVELDRESGYPGYSQAMTIRSGDIVIPRISTSEPLRAECVHFLNCIRSGEVPRTDGADGLAVVRILAAARRSVEQNGASVAV